MIFFSGLQRSINIKVGIVPLHVSIFLLPILLGIVFFAGCFGGRVIDVSPMIGSGSEGPACVPVTYTKTAASREARPPWALVPPEDVGGTHYLIGISGFHSTERDARDDAMRYARGEFARYTGVEVSQLDEFSRVTYGKASGLLDPTILGKVQSNQESDAMVRRTRAKEWYFEKLQATCRGSDRGIAYQYWVLAEVPVEEYEKVQTWKAKHETDKEAAKTEERLVTEKAADQLIISHRAAIAQAGVLIAKSDPIAALTILQADWSRLYEAGKAMEAKGSFAAFPMDQVLALRQEIPLFVQRVQAPLVIDTGRDSTILVSSEEESITEVQTWMWYRQEGQIAAVSGMPLVLKEGTRLISRGTSGSDGNVKFQAKEIKPGNYEIYIDLQSGLFVSLAPPIREALAAMGATLSVKSYPPDMEGAIQTGVQRLFKGPSLKPLPATKVVMGSVRYADTRRGSEFGQRLETLIEREIAQISQVKLIRPQTTRGPEALARADRSRGIGLTDRPLPSMGSPAMQAELDGAEAALEATYSLNQKEVSLDLRLIEAGTGRILAAAGTRIDRALIPTGLQLIQPSSAEELLPIVTGQSGEIHLELTTQRGDGVTFAEGEKIQYLVSSNQDAYLLLLYKDASGRLIQIYPNTRSGTGFHKAGEYMEIPDRMSTFDFTISPPFGVEQVWAFAATTPFPSLKSQSLSNGLAVLKEEFTSITAQLRAHGRKPKVSYGEVNVVVTTVKE